jgi:hypothetical protein
MRRYFANLDEAIGDRDASTVWNCDESGFCPQGRSGGRVLCGKGMNANVLRSSDKENVSLMTCVAANGSSMSLMFIFPGKYRQLEWMDGTHKDAVCAVTESSYINSNIFFHWLSFLTVSSAARFARDGRPFLPHQPVRLGLCRKTPDRLVRASCADVTLHSATRQRCVQMPEGGVRTAA